MIRRGDEAEFRRRPKDHHPPPQADLGSISPRLETLVELSVGDARRLGKTDLKTGLGRGPARPQGQEFAREVGRHMRHRVVRRGPRALYGRVIERIQSPRILHQIPVRVGVANAVGGRADEARCWLCGECSMESSQSGFISSSFDTGPRTVKEDIGEQSVPCLDFGSLA